MKTTNAAQQERSDAKDVKRTEHTPGPWGVGECVDETIEIRAGQTRYPIASMVIAKPPYRAKNDAEIARLNARLISAAPELLEAAKLDEEIFNKSDELFRLQDTPNHSGGAVLALQKEIDELRDKQATVRRAAIAKAEGKEKVK